MGIFISVKRILIIRFHAFGDTLIILPYVNGLKKRHPNYDLDLLTLSAHAEIPRALSTFRQVIALPGGRSQARIALHVLIRRIMDLRVSYDYILDLQNNKVSRVVSLLYPRATVFRFEKYASLFAGKRYLQTVHQLAPYVEPAFDLGVGMNEEFQALESKENRKWIVINPAGFFKTRNWPIEYYEDLMSRLVQRWHDRVRFLLLGDKRIVKKARTLQDRYPDHVINLVNKTTQVEALCVLSQCDLVVSEDSGLGHMAWIQGVKTLFLFGSTRSDWTAPPYAHVHSFTSSDLACGDCMKPECIFGDVRCLVRYTPDIIERQVLAMLDL